MEVINEVMPEAQWHEVDIAMCPFRADTVRMTSSKGWRDISVHRIAGLAGHLSIESVELPGAFG